MTAAAPVAEALTLESLAWIAREPRTYREAIDAWVSNCPRHPVWDDAVTHGLVEVVDGHVALSARGSGVLEGGDA